MTMVGMTVVVLALTVGYDVCKKAKTTTLGTSRPCPFLLPPYQPVTASFDARRRASRAFDLPSGGRVSLMSSGAGGNKTGAAEEWTDLVALNK